MIKANITWTDPDGEHSGVVTLLDWINWEKHTGKSAADLGSNFKQVQDVVYLAWSVARRDGEKRPFDGFVARLEGMPDIEAIGTEDPTKPGA